MISLPYLDECKKIKAFIGAVMLVINEKCVKVHDCGEVCYLGYFFPKYDIVAVVCK